MITSIYMTQSNQIFFSFQKEIERMGYFHNPICVGHLV